MHCETEYRLIIKQNPKMNLLLPIPHLLLTVIYKYIYSQNLNPINLTRMKKTNMITK